MTIKDIKKYYKFRNLKWPDGKSALDFSITEIGEAMDAYIRENQSGWTRNNPDKQSNLGWELADVYQMIAIAAYEQTGKSLSTLLKEKWKSKGFDIENEHNK